jgi:hypothetical protein
MGASRPVGNTWVTDMRHFLDGAGAIADIPGPGLNLALFLGAIVAWVTSGRSAADPRTNVSCRRSPARRRCPGEILASFEAAGEHITARKAGIVGEDLLQARPCREEIEDQGHPDAVTTYAGLAEADVRVNEMRRSSSSRFIHLISHGHAFSPEPADL